jgi:hypothetical protein
MKKIYFLLPIVCLLSCSKKGDSPSTTNSATTYNVSLLAGGPGGFEDGQGSSANFLNITAIIKDHSGNFLIADGSRIRKVTPQGLVTTYAGDKTPNYQDGNLITAKFGNISAIVLSPNNDIYVGDGYAVGATTAYIRIRKITADGTVSTVAGNLQGYADGKGTNAQFFNISGMALDASGNLFVCDSHTRIRKITPDGTVSTFVGNGTLGNVDGKGTNASLGIWQIVFDSAGNIYGTDQSMIKKITPDGTVTTFTGSPTTYPVPATSNTLSSTYGITIDGSGNLYVTNGSPNGVKKVTTTGVVSTLGGISNITAP